MIQDCEEQLKLMERRFEEIKDGKELSNLMMSEETLTTLANLKIEKVIKLTTNAQEKKLVKNKMIQWIKSRKRMGGGAIGQLAEMEMAKELFNLWDESNMG